MFKDTAAENGFELAITVDRLGAKGARLKGVNLKRDDDVIFAANDVTLTYEWREILKGNVEKITLDQVFAAIEVDKTGKISNSWMPERSENSSQPPIILPPKGIALKNASLKLTSPYGEINAVGQINFVKPNDFNADIKITETELTFGKISARGGGHILANIAPGRNDVKADLNFARISHPIGTVENSVVNAALNLDLINDDSVISGPITARFERLNGILISSGNGLAKWDGSLTVPPNVAAIIAGQGQWELDVKNVSYAAAQDRQALAEKLLAYNALSVTPIAMNFASPLRDEIVGLLSQSNVKAKGTLTRKGPNVDIALSAPLSAQKPGLNAIIHPTPNAPLYHYNRETQQLNLTASAHLNGNFPVELHNLTLKSRSSNGVKFDGIKMLGATLKTKQSWRTDQANLAPFSMPFTYANEDNVGTIKAQTSIQYNGPLPGGNIQELDAQGHIVSRIEGELLTAKFTPLSDTKVTLSQFDTSTSTWDLAATQAVLTSPLTYKKLGKTATLLAEFKDVETEMAETTDNASLDLSLPKLMVKATVTEASQKWDLIIPTLTGRSDTLMGPGVSFASEGITLGAVLSPMALPEIDLTAVSASVTTPQIKTTNLPVNLLGTLENMALTYGKLGGTGTIEAIGMNYPALPLFGTASYKNGTLKGTARTKIPKSKNSQVDVTYAYSQGSGTANVEVTGLEFKRNKLQPQTYIPALKGKIADVSGLASGTFDFTFKDNAISQSSGKVKLIEMSFGTLPGPFKGVNTTISLASVFPLQTQGIQTLSVAEFDPGVPLLNGIAEYELLPMGIKIYSAIWPMGNGDIALTPTVWDYTADRNVMTVNVNDVSIGAFLNTETLTVTGDVNGSFPVMVEGLDVSVVDGVLRVKEGGVISYRPKGAKNPEVPSGAISSDILSNPSELAANVLKNFHYNALEASLNGPLDGEITVGMEFLGKNPDLLGGTEFDLNINVSGELMNLARSIKVSGNMGTIKQLLARQKQPQSLPPDPTP